MTKATQILRSALFFFLLFSVIPLVMRTALTFKYRDLDAEHCDPAHLSYNIGRCKMGNYHFVARSRSPEGLIVYLVDGNNLGPLIDLVSTTRTDAFRKARFLTLNTGLTPFPNSGLFVGNLDQDPALEVIVYETFRHGVRLSGIQVEGSKISPEKKISTLILAYFIAYGSWISFTLMVTAIGLLVLLKMLKSEKR